MTIRAVVVDDDKETLNLFCHVFSVTMGKSPVDKVVDIL